MAKPSSRSEDIRQLERNLVRGLNRLRDQHEAAEKDSLRAARANTLHRIADIIERVAAQGDPRRILAIERHCEQFYLAFFANAMRKRQGSVRALQTMSRLAETLALPLDPERYRQYLASSVGPHNMDKIPAVPEDDFHLFVRSQTQRLTKAAGQFAATSEERYFRVRQAALKNALKSHEEECERALEAIEKGATAT